MTKMFVPHPTLGAYWAMVLLECLWVWYEIFKAMTKFSIKAHPKSKSFPTQKDSSPDI